jgi:hypothetical protein
MTLDQLVIDIQAQSTDATSGLDRLSASLNSLRAAAKGGVGLTAVSNQLKKLNEALSTMTAPAEKITELVNALKPLASIEKSNLGSAVSQLKKLPEIAASLKSMDMGAFADSIQRVTAAIAPLAAEMQKVANGFSAFPAKIQRIIAQNDRLSSSNGKTSSSFKSLGGNLLATIAKFTAIFYLLKRVAGVISGWVTTSIEYAENLNLFNASMGEYADEMYAYAEKVNEVVGIDPSEWIRNQGAFMALATSIGIASDKAVIMSKNLTQLGYDLSSLWNVNFQTAMDKLQSGIVGQTKAVRAFGLDVTDAAISETALMYGITKSTDAMSQAEKMQLRYITMLRQSTLAQGDLARTLESPQNQLRIFKSQLQQTARALGNIFIPIINAVLPYLMAFVKLVRMAADALARLFGFSLPEVDYSSLTDGVNAGTDLEDSLDGANGAAKELKGTLAGFDELNVITQTETGGSGGAGGGVGGGDLGIELPEYDFLGDAIGKKVDDIIAKFKRWLPLIKLVGKALLLALGVAVISKIVKGLSNLASTIGAGGLLGGFTKLKAGILGFIAAGVAAATAAYALTINGFDPLAAAAISAVGAFALIGPALYAAMGPIGLIIAAVGALTGALVGVSLAQDQLRKEMIDAQLYDNQGIALSTFTDYVTAASMAITDHTDKINEMGTAFEDTRTSIFDAIDTIGRLATKYSIVGGTISEEDVPRITEAINSIYEGTRSNMSLAISMIQTELTDAFATASENIGLSADEILSSIYLVQSMGDPILAKMQQDMNDAVMKLSDPNLSQEEWNTAWNTISNGNQIFSDINTAVDDLATSFNTDLQSALSRIDFTSKDDLVAGMEEIGKIYADTLAEMDAAEKASLESAQTIRSYYENVPGLKEMIDKRLAETGAPSFDETYAAMIQNITDNYDTKEAEFKRQAETIAGAITSEFTGAIDTAAQNASKDPMFSDWVVAFFKNPMEAIGGNLGYYVGGVAEERTKELYKEIIAAFNKASKDSGLNADLEAGKELVDGLATGIQENGYLASDALVTLMSDLLDIPPTMSDSHSPSKVFEGYAKDDIDGYIQGIGAKTTEATTAMTTFMGKIKGAITTNKPSVTSAFKSMLNEMLSYMETFTSRIASALNSMLSGFASTMRSMDISSSGSVSYSRMTQQYIPRLDTGGQVSSGQLFFARENGIPEMVGSMGNKATVANNGQIQEGIADAVYRAIVDSGLIGYIRSIDENAARTAEKDLTLGAPNAEAGRWVTRSQNIYAKATG